MSLLEVGSSPWNQSARRKTLPSLTNMSKLAQAVARGDSAQVKSLLSSTAFDVNETDGDKNTCLHLAAGMNHLSVAQILIEKGANVDARDCNWLTPMHRACRNNNDSIVKLLIENQADINVKDKEWISPLHVCAANNSLECVKLFASELKDRANATDRSGATALHHAALNGNCDMIVFLIGMGCEVNVHDNNQRSPLHYAASTDNGDAIRILVSSGAKLNARDKTSKTPIHFAAASGSLNAMQTLLDLGGDITAVAACGCNALHWAALNGQDDIIEELLRRKYDLINSTDSRGLTPLHLASGSAVGAASVEALVLHLPHLNINAVDKRNRSAMHLAAQFGRTTALQELIRCEADVNISEKGTMMVPLHYAIRSKGVSIVDALLSRPSVSIDVVDSAGMTPLHHAAFYRLPNMVKHLIYNSASPYHLDISGRPPSFLAALSGELDCLQQLLTCTSDILSHLDNFNRSPLHYAAASGPKAFSCLEYLLSLQSDPVNSPFNVNQKDIYGRSPLIYAAESDTEGDMIDLLITHGAQIDVTDENGLCVLNYAAAAGNTVALQSLIPTHYWQSVDFALCPSQCAAFYGHSECLSLLLKDSIYTDLKKSIEYSRRCSSSGCYEVIQAFVNSASDTSIRAEMSEYFSASESFFNLSSSAFEDLSRLDSATLLSSPFKEAPCVLASEATASSSSSPPAPPSTSPSSSPSPSSPSPSSPTPPPPPQPIHQPLPSFNLLSQVSITNDVPLDPEKLINNNYSSKKTQENQFLSQQQVKSEILSNGSSASKVVHDSSQSEF